MSLDIQNPAVFFTICAVWAAVMIAMLISATRLCYQVEARSARPSQKGGMPGFANLIPVAFNIGVADDRDTQRLRWRMNQRLLVILVGFAFFAAVLNAAGA